MDVIRDISFDVSFDVRLKRCSGGKQGSLFFAGINGGDMQVGLRRPVSREGFSDFFVYIGSECPEGISGECILRRYRGARTYGRRQKKRDNNERHILNYML